MQKSAVPVVGVILAAAALTACSVVDAPVDSRRGRHENIAKNGAIRWSSTAGTGIDVVDDMPAPWSSIPYYAPLPESDGLSRRLAEQQLRNIVEVVGRPVIRGSLARDVINRYIERRRTQLRSCHQHAMRQQRGLDGRMTIRFIIGPVGRVTTASVLSSTVGHPQVEQCIIDVFRTMEFPSCGMGIVIAEYELLVRS